MNAIKSLFRLALGARLPLHAGEIRVAKAQETIVIRRDRHGVPTVQAGSDHDAWFGLGFCQGQDRAGQLELLARTVRGTLAEVAGPDMLPLDRLSRRIGFRRAAEAQLAVADPDVRAQMQAFCAGVNQGIARGGPKRDHLFALLRCRPTQWEPADVQGMIVVLCFALASNWDVEIVRLRMLLEDGPEALRKTDPVFAGGEVPVVDPPGGWTAQTGDRLASDLELFLSHHGGRGGSNGWVLGPEKTASGRPLLSNDPHLNPVLPTYWYLAHLQAPDWRACGATFVGVPAIAAGHNGHIAWGITAAQSDNTDLFVERIGSDGRSVMAGDRAVPCPVRVETIRVRGKKTHRETVLETPRGPVVSPVLAAGDLALSMRATWLAPRPYRGLLAVHRVQSFEQFRNEFRQGSASAVSMVYADAKGDIGWMLGVEAPRRKKGNGTLPLCAWDEEVGWEAKPVAFELIPWAKNPPGGVIATANSQPVEADDEPFLGVDFVDPYRQQAAYEALAARGGWTVSGLLTLQLDTRSLPWEQMREGVCALAPDDPDAQQALGMLRDWDGNLRPEASAASVFVFFSSAMIDRILRAAAPKTAEWAKGKSLTMLSPVNMFAPRRLRWLVRLLEERPAGIFTRPWEHEMEDALGEAVRTLRAAHGDDPARWRWERVRPLRLVHQVSEQPPLGRVYDLGPCPPQGDAATIAQGAVDATDPAANPASVATLRMVIDVGDWDRSRYALIHGQSGNPFSPHYEDQAGPFHQARGIPIAWSPEAIERATRSTLRLVPVGPAGRER